MAITRNDLFQRIWDALYDYENFNATELGAPIAVLANWVVDNGFADYLGKQLEAPDVPDVPVERMTQEEYDAMVGRYARMDAILSRYTK
jgi:hypothetical protein